MRTPWYIVVLLATAVFGGVLWLGVRHKDHTSAPSDQAIAQSVSEWRRKHPSLPPRERALPSPQPVEKIKAEPENLSAPQIPLGQLETMPGLEYFREHRDYGTDSFIQLATQLESSGRIDHALLAWERVIDSTDTNAEQSLKARKAITALRSAQTVWINNSDDHFNLVLHVNTPTEHKTQISALLGQISDDIRDASSHQIAPQVLLKIIPQRDGYPSPPIRVWFSSIGKQAKETPQLTLHLNEDEAPLDELLYMSIYRSISGQLQQSSELMPPATLSATETPRASLTTNLTRLHWKEFCHSLHVEQEKIPRAVIIAE
jgi:hypothetical protein